MFWTRMALLSLLKQRISSDDTGIRKPGVSGVNGWMLRCPGKMLTPVESFIYDYNLSTHNGYPRNLVLVCLNG